jgi:cytohesin
MVVLLLENGADASARENAGLSPLHFAAMQNRTAVVEVLLQNGAEIDAAVNSPDMAGDTALHLAKRHSAVAAYQLLLDKGADPTLRNKKGETASDVSPLPVYSTAFHSAVATADLQGAQAMLDATPGLLAGIDGDGCTPLLVAARHDQAESMEWLRSRGATAGARCAANDAAFWSAIATGDLTAVENLTVATPKLIEEKNDRGCVPILVAARNGQSKILQWLITKGATVDSRCTLDGYEDATPLHAAALTPDPSTTRLLLERGADLHLQARRGALTGFTPLHLAATARNREAMKLLLDANVARDATLSGDGPESRSTAMHLAMRSQDLEAVELLLNAGADPKAKDASGKLPHEYLPTDLRLSYHLFRIERGIVPAGATPVDVTQAIEYINEYETELLSTSDTLSVTAVGNQALLLRRVSALLEILKAEMRGGGTRSEERVATSALDVIWFLHDALASSEFALREFTLLDAGQEPRTRLRFRPTGHPGARRTIARSQSLVLTTREAGREETTEKPITEYLPVFFEANTAEKSSADEQKLDISFIIPVADRIFDESVRVKGRPIECSLRTRISRWGAIRDITGNFCPQVRNEWLYRMGLQFPLTPVGVGARWQTVWETGSDRAILIDTTLRVSSECELVEVGRFGGKVRVRVTLSATPGSVQLFGDQGTVDLTRLSGDGTGAIQFSFLDTFPVAQTLNTTISYDMRKEGRGFSLVAKDTWSVTTPGFTQEGEGLDVEPPETSLTVPSAVPPITLASVAPAKGELARQRYDEANRLLRRGNAKAAVQKYVQALQADPTHIYARYNLACSYARIGDQRNALAVLRQFREAGCLVCLRRLVRAREDRDFSAYWSHPDFVSITSGFILKDPNYERLSYDLASTFRYDKFQSSFGAGRTVSFRYVDINSHKKPRRHFTVSTMAELREALGRDFALRRGEERSSGGDVRIKEAGGRWVCDQQSGTDPLPCCRLESASLCDGPEAWSAVTSICFWPVSADVAAPVSVGITVCP